MNFDLILIFSFGTVFLITAIMLAIKIPQPTSFQLFIFRTALALAAAGVAAAIPGFFEITSTFEELSIRAGGRWPSLCLFIVLTRQP